MANSIGAPWHLMQNLHPLHSSTEILNEFTFYDQHGQ